MAVTNNMYQRTFHIRCGTKCGTCFTVNFDRKRYLVTAKHIAGSIRDKETVEILHHGIWKPVAVHLVGHGTGDVDVSVLASEKLFGASHQLLATTAHMTLSEDVYFLGFPFGMSFDIGALNYDYPMPLVKKAIISAMYAEKGLILLDGHNNPGFSGGPVVRAATSNQIIGVVSGYQSERQAVLDEAGNKGSYTYDMNTGIVRVYDSKQIEKIVLQNPIGIDVN